MDPLLDPQWIDVAGGSFWMGGGLRANEQPRHRVTLGPFRLARTPVCRGQYQRFLAVTGRAAPSCWHEPAFAGDELPAVGVTWHDAAAYCAWLAELSSDRVRLPTEAEWEYAACAGREVAYPWGDEPPESLTDYASRWLEGPEPVDAYASQHPWRFAGMCENVHEWCADWYDADYYASSPEHDPQGPTSGRRRASRGGAWRHQIKVCRITHRSSIPPDKSYSDYGFRVAADPVPGSPAPGSPALEI